MSRFARAIAAPCPWRAPAWSQTGNGSPSRRAASSSAQSTARVIRARHGGADPQAGQGGCIHRADDGHAVLRGAAHADQARRSPPGAKAGRSQRPRRWAPGPAGAASYACGRRWLVRRWSSADVPSRSRLRPYATPEPFAGHMGRVERAAAVDGKGRQAGCRLGCRPQLIWPRTDCSGSRGPASCTSRGALLAGPAACDHQLGLGQHGACAVQHLPRLGRGVLQPCHGAVRAQGDAGLRQQPGGQTRRAHPAGAGVPASACVQGQAGGGRVIGACREQSVPGPSARAAGKRIRRQGGAQAPRPGSSPRPPARGTQTAAAWHARRRVETRANRLSSGDGAAQTAPPAGRRRQQQGPWQHRAA